LKGIKMPTLDEIIAQMEESAEAARLANIRRQQQAEAIYDEIIARYGPGGTYGRAAEALLERQKIGDVGAGAQRLISAGLYGTEVGGGLERAWEAEVGAPARLRLEDIKMERLSQAQLGKAGFVERIEDVGPDYGMMMQYLAQAANVPGAAAGGGYGGYGGTTPGYEFGWSGFPEEPTPPPGGYRGALYGQEPEERDLDYWLEQGYTGYGPAFEPEAGAETIDWTKGGRGTYRARGIFVAPGTTTPIYADPTTGRIRKKAQFPGGAGGTFGGYGATGAW